MSYREVDPSVLVSVAALAAKYSSGYARVESIQMVATVPQMRAGTIADQPAEKQGDIVIAKKAKKAKEKDVLKVSESELKMSAELIDITKSIKELEARKAELQAELFPILEDRRTELCFRKQEWISGGKVGTATYYVTNRWTGTDVGDSAAMAELRGYVAEMGLNADRWIETCMEKTYRVSIEPEAMSRPEVVALFKSLGDAVKVTATLTPNSVLSESLPGTVNYDVLSLLESKNCARRHIGVLR